MVTQGNFFDHRNENFAKGLNDSILDIAVLGSAKVKDQLYKGHGFRTGYLKSSVHGGLVKNLQGQIDAGKLMRGRNVRYAIFVEQMPRFRMFRNVARWLNKMPSEVADIIKFHVGARLN